MKITTNHSRIHSARRAAFTLLEVLVVVAIIVILASVASVAVFRNLEDAKKSQAQLKAKAIDTAIKAYTTNPNFDGDHSSVSINGLLQPPWGGTSYLPNGQADLIDPWGKEYTIQPTTGPDGAHLYLVTTTANDGTHISQMGQGQKAGW